MLIPSSRVPAEVPSGITFGNKVVKLPYTSNTFNRPIWIQACLSNNPKTLFKPYTWVNRGEALVEYTILTPKTGIPIIDFFSGYIYNKIYLKSPVSGLLIHSTHDFGNADTFNICNTSFLLPDDEPPPVNGDIMFSPLCDFCWGYREHIFYKPSELKGRHNDQSLKSAFDEQKNRECKVVEAMPDYEEYFQEARTRHPQLRPLLKHLL